jgi:phosphatidylserine decarboxylase
MNEKIIEELNKLVSERANERYILSKLKTLRYQKIGQENIDNLIECLRWKDVDYNEKKKIKMSDVSMTWYDDQPYETYIEYFNRYLKKDFFAQIKYESLNHRIIIPNECTIESIGQIKDMSSIIRLKKDSKTTLQDLKDLGVNENYSFINMKLFVSYYHHVHSPVTGKIVRMIPIEGENNIFGKNTLWFLEFQTDNNPVYMLIVGESLIQDFNFLVKKNMLIDIADELGYFAWGSQTILLFDKNDYPGEYLIQKKNHYFLGQQIV